MVPSFADELRKLIKGDVADDLTMRTLYATDASAYRELPGGVVYPRDEQDVAFIVKQAAKLKIPLIPRGAGTSLAGQVVGNGWIVDVSKYLTHIVELNVKESWVIVEPGVVLDELNLFLKSHGLFFGPETSTSSRCNLGGMVGNNSCGAHSLVYGSTRDHLIEVSGFLSDGSHVVFGPIDLEQFEMKCASDTLEGNIYKGVRDLLSHPLNQEAIKGEFPHPAIKRRNTGYALDALLELAPFNSSGTPFNFCKLLAGSEGTLMVMTRIKLHLNPLPPPFSALMCVHFNSLHEALQSNLVALEFSPVAVELMDKTILDLTRGNSVQLKNRFFVQGDPQALLLVEFAAHHHDELSNVTSSLKNALQQKGMGYAFPVLYGDQIRQVWELRKAGLGVLSNVPGDEFPVPVIEDTAVRVEDLPNYIAEIQAMLHRYGKSCIYYAHVGTGELHLRPVLNMKHPDDIRLFREIATETACIVKKFRGSLSGEHGDGRLRGEMISIMVGSHNYENFRKLKNLFDPNNILNPGKITDTPPMDTFLRYRAAKPVFQPIFNWSHTGGLLQGAERCNGSADCRKSAKMGGTMCPSFMVTHDEWATPRARANLMREFLNGSVHPTSQALDEVMKVLSLCLSCKACKSECPSSVDISRLKAEMTHYSHSVKGSSFRDKLFAYQPVLFKYASYSPSFFNALIGSRLGRGVLARFFNLAPDARFPKVQANPFRNAVSKSQPEVLPEKSVYLFVDEFVKYSDAQVGVACVKLLEHLGYHVIIPPHLESGRTYLSKGFLLKARRVANQNVIWLADKISPSAPLVGIEPSAILTFRDEYPDLVDDAIKDASKIMSHCTFTIEEFLAAEFDAGRIDRSLFTSKPLEIQFHGHCYQKSLSDTSVIKKILEIPQGYKAVEIKSGCCGMAGAFGYEKEHAEFAKAVGELVLFPAVRGLNSDTILVASGSSCRQHLKSNTGKTAYHPAEVLCAALLS
jgi:FAD/FMN-containing dehydrogenase/Fe-S oxidoreductase